MRFIDTNILLYSISTARGESLKAETARTLLARRDNALSVQVLREFYVQATRATRADAVPHAVAVGLIASWLRFPVQQTDLAVFHRALAIKAKHALSYWDAAIVAAAVALGCDQLLSEDMADGTTIDGVTIRNPFRSG